MISPNRGRLKRIGLLLIVASIILFAVSVYIVSSGTSEYTVNTLPGSTFTFTKQSVQAGDDLTFKVSVEQNVAISSSLISPGGMPFSTLNYTHLPSGTNSITVPDSGNWTLHILNSGNFQVNLTVGLDSLQKTAVIGAHKAIEYVVPSVQAQHDISYSLSLNQSPKVAASLVSPTGDAHSSLNLTSTSPGSKTIVAPSSGAWSLQIKNNGSLPVNVSVSLGDVSYFTLGLTVFGVALLPGGIALVAVYAYSVRMEKKKMRLRGAP